LVAPSTIRAGFTGGTINVQTFDATLKGGGQIALLDFADDDFINVPASLTLTNVDNTISGAGGVQGLGTLINQAGGTINANLPAIAPLNILLPVKNSGLMEATVSGAALIIENKVDNTGGGVIKAFDSASVEFVSAVIVGGTLIQVNKGATIGLDDDTTLDGTGTHPVTISGNYVTVGRLNLEGTINAGGKTTLDGSFGNVDEHSNHHSGGSYYASVDGSVHWFASRKKRLKVPELAEAWQWRTLAKRGWISLGEPHYYGSFDASK